MTAAFDAEVARALRLLDVDETAAASDAIADPKGAARALERLAEGAEGRRILRVAPAHRAGAGAGAEAAYGPLPVDPLWVLLRRGSAEVVLAPLRLRERREGEARAGGEGSPFAGLVEARRAQVAKVAVETAQFPCCDAPSCDRRRTRASVWLDVDVSSGGGSGAIARLLVAEAMDLAPERAIGQVRAVASKLARVLGVPLEAEAAAGAEAEAGAGDERDEAELPALPAGLLARYALRSEGDRLVLRDLAVAGPRVSAARTIGTGVVLLAAAVALWVLTGRAAGGESLAQTLAFGALAALVSLTAYGFLGVGRFAAKYAAESAPLVALGRDRLIVGPWVSRQGAVDLRPEGRLGAAIPMREVQGASVRLRDGRAAVELATDHGDIDALSSDRKEVAELWCAAILRSVEEVRHPASGASARQRARARGAMHHGAAIKPGA